MAPPRREAGNLARSEFRRKARFTRLLLRVPSGPQPLAPPNLHVTARNADKQIVYTGGVT
ncbi:hypothetical protein [Lentzea flava]|uniref:Uncharacterized protein n=1 Tax=Lentzea flava TaxID=103732 RepID=A0ABQ2UGV6_9PSEU|nr:hypothetical protein [Lentzea flava]MCP2199156.1 hypothetical protein [Lentzea flava]GGU34117.1 hypothetical protein GCM10010178_27910 [Lentzea flava]